MMTDSIRRKKSGRQLKQYEAKNTRRRRYHQRNTTACLQAFPEIHLRTIKPVFKAGMLSEDLEIGQGNTNQETWKRRHK